MARRLALTALAEWRRGGRFADAILQPLLAQSKLGPADRAFATELFYGVLRNLSLLDFWLGQLRPTGLDDDSRDLLRLGLYQLLCLRTPSHAAVFETVELADRRSRALINGVLRAALRRIAELEDAAKRAPLAIRFSHPPFLVERWTKAFGAEATAALCEWNNQTPPLYARINRLRRSTEQFPPSAVAENFVLLSELPRAALERGEIYIQDPSTALACELLDPQPGEKILDACAAPGGKAAYLAELMQNRGTLVACDRDPLRVPTLRENLKRLGATIAQTIEHDWQSKELPPLLAAASLDRALIDAPCSNTGVMRRRVDVRWRLRPADFERMPNEQFAIVRAVLPLLKPGGVLVYSTCSLEAEENAQLVARLLREFPSLRLLEEKSVLPFRDHLDGAFAAKLILHA